MTRAPAVLAILSLIAAPAPAQRPAEFTIEQVKSLPFPNELTAAATGQRLAWAFDERGQRNIWVAEGPDFKARRLTGYMMDDGQELTSVAISADAKWVVTSGGEPRRELDRRPRPTRLLPVAPKIQVWSVPFAGGCAALLAEGDAGGLSRERHGGPSFPRGGQVSRASGSTASVPAKRMFFAKGAIGRGPMVSRRLPAGIHLEPGRPRLHRRLHQRFHAAHLDRALHLAGRLAALVSRWHPAGVHPAAGVGRPAGPDAGAASPAVEHLDRGRSNRSGAGALAGAGDAAGIAVQHRGRDQSPLGRGGPDRLSLLRRRLAPSLFAGRGRRRSAPAHPGRVHGRVHPALAGRKVPGVCGAMPGATRTTSTGATSWRCRWTAPRRRS